MVIGSYVSAGTGIIFASGLQWDVGQELLVLLCLLRVALAMASTRTAAPNCVHLSLTLLAGHKTLRTDRQRYHTVHFRPNHATQ